MFAHCLPLILTGAAGMWGYKTQKSESGFQTYPREEPDYPISSPYMESMDQVGPENDFTPTMKTIPPPEPIVVTPSISVLYLEQTTQQQTWNFLPIRYIRWMEIRLVCNVGITPDPNSTYCYATSNTLANRQMYCQNTMVTSQSSGTQRSQVVWLQPCPGGVIPPLSDQLPAIQWQFRDLAEIQNVNLTLTSDTGGFFVFSGEVQKLLWEVRLGTEST